MPPVAPDRLVREAAAFGAIQSNALTERERRYLVAIARERPEATDDSCRTPDHDIERNAGH